MSDEELISLDAMSYELAEQNADLDNGRDVKDRTLISIGFALVAIGQRLERLSEAIENHR